MDERTCARCGAPVPRKTSKYCSRQCFALDKVHDDHVTVTCPCGARIEVAAWEAAKRRYCSQACKYRYRARPSGLKYNTKVINRAWRKPGDAPTSTSFQPGHDTWNKAAGPRHMDRPGYSSLHRRLRKERGRAGEHQCSLANDTCKGPMQWANISHEYRDTSDFMPLCQSHHVRYDGGLL
jgi:hypothetical protein